MGRFAEVDALAERAMAAGHPGLLRFTSGFGQTTALLMAGELDRAQELAQQLHRFRAAAAAGPRDRRGAGGRRADRQGRARVGGEAVAGAAAALAPTGYSWGPLAWMLLAQALGQLGEMVEAAKVLSRAESRHGLKSMLFAPELALAGRGRWRRDATSRRGRRPRGKRHARPSAAASRRSRCGRCTTRCGWATSGRPTASRGSLAKSIVY